MIAAFPKGNSTGLDQLLRAEKIRIVCRNTPMILLGNLLGSVPFAIVLSSYDMQSVLVWISALYSVLLVRFLYIRIPDIKSLGLAELQRYDQGQTILIFITGCVWGAGGYSFFDTNNILTVLMIVLTFVSMIAGSLVSLSSRPFAYVCFSSPVMLPMIWFMFRQDDWEYNWLSFGAAVYLFATFGFSRTIHKVIDSSIRLQYENYDLIEDLKKETDRANRASQDKSRFLAAASHDLRQPLQAVNLFTEVLSKKVNNESQKEDLSNIQQGLGTLNELLDALFDVSRLDSELMTVRKGSFNLDELMEKLERQFALEARLRNLNFTIDRSHQIVDTDPMLLERVLTNLLVNAFRYTPSGSIRLWFSDTEDSVQIHIEDTGIGIPKDSIEAIFTEFYQVNNKERDQRQGLGLGLAIVRRVLELLGHKIRVSSESGKGSIFTLEIAKGDAVHQPVEVQQEVLDSQSPFDGLKVMVVDNEESIVKAMDQLLTSWGATVSSHFETVTALDLIASGEFIPDFVIVDFRMPCQYNGAEFIHEARQLIHDIPALIVTGDTSEEIIEVFREQGCDYLHKPIKPVQLRMIIQRILARSNP